MERARIGNNCTCAAAIFHVQISLLGPMYRRHTKRLFGDLALIRHLIERNKNLDHFNVTRSRRILKLATATKHMSHRKKRFATCRTILGWSAKRSKFFYVLTNWRKVSVAITTRSRIHSSGMDT
jgi:hypothetical protein